MEKEKKETLSESQLLEMQIKQSEEERARLKESRFTATAENIATIDKNIILTELRIKRLKESQQLQELQEQGKIPADMLAQSKMYLVEMTDQVCQDGIDMNSDEPRLIAAERLCNIIDQLELLRMADEKKDFRFSDMADFTEQFSSFINEKSEKVKKAKGQLHKQDMEIQHLETLLNEAISAGNPEEIIAYSDSLETARKAREYLEPMVKASEQSETFPPETISTAWKNICDIYRHEWLLRLEIINTAQEIHLSACNELIELTNYLNSLRSEIQRIGKENGSPEQIDRYNAQITVSVDRASIKEIKRDQYERINRIFHDPEKRL